jgi:hypothetical protein
MIKNFLISICLFSFLVFLSSTAYACSCSFGSLRGTFSSSDAVFIGKVSKIEIVKKARVGLLMKESGTLELLKIPRWEKSFEKMQIVTLEVIEPFKGATEKTFTLITRVYNGGGSCGVPFKIGESFLVFADKTQPLLSKEETDQPKESWTLEMRLNAEADEFNKQLPPYQTNICMRTDRLRFMNEEIEEIRGFLKNGVWKEEKQLPIRVIY